MKIYVLTQSEGDDREEGIPAYFTPIRAFYTEGEAIAWRDGLLESWRVSAEEHWLMHMHPLTLAHFEIAAVELE